MQVTRLEFSGLRCFERDSLQPGPGVNLLIGANGSGKSSVLEALHLMAYGRSFRGRVRDGLVRDGADAVEVFVEWVEAGGRVRRAGLRHRGQAWEGRLDGAPLAQLGDLCAALAVVTFEPGSHALVMGPAETRRRFVDWGLFHVEPEFLVLWRRYGRALRQRNALLKGRQRDAQLDAWEHELDQAGTALSQHRDAYLQQLQPYLAATAQALLPEAGEASFCFQPGWRRDELSLADALLLARERDFSTGFTSVGPHRADWRIVQAAIPRREALSRGQAKLTALAALLAQAEHQAARRGDWPIVALDDLASELDRPHQQLVLQRLQGYGAQVLVTGTEAPASLAAESAETRVFHVELGTISSERH
ncbi:MAG: DNA replication/repair protein RecF [Luteimonas sp.]